MMQEMKRERPIAIHVEDLTMAYRESPVLWDLDLDIPQGVLAAILGPNGAGKSTLIKGIMGLLPCLSGQIRIFGMPFKRVYREVAYVPQTGEVNWDFPTTVADVAMMGRYSKLPPFLPCRRRDRERALGALETMGLLEMRDRQISELSGGQRQRVFLARALCQEAKIFLMDEPLQGVDKKTEAVIMEQLFALRDQGKTIVVVHHDLNTVKEYFDHVVMLNKVVVAAGDVREVFCERNIQRAYGSSSLFLRPDREVSAHEA